MVRGLRSGFKLFFKEKPVLTDSPLFFEQPLDSVRKEALHAEVTSLIEKRVLEPAPPNTPGFYSRLFLVRKKDSNKWRPVIDLSRLNKFLVVPKFSMETAEKIRLSLQRGDWTVSIDLKDAYLHIPMAPQTKRFMRIVHRGQVWQFRALPFGLSTSPWIFTQVMGEVKEMAASRGIFIHQYLDDWLIKSQNEHTLRENVSWLQTLCTQLGLQINYEKSELIPKREFIFLGYQFNTVTMEVKPPQVKLEKMEKLVHRFLTTQPLQAILWQSLLGTLSDLVPLVHLGKIHTRDLQYCLKSQWTQSLTSQNQNLSVWKDQGAISELLWWADRGNTDRGVPIHRCPNDLQVFTDSSLQGWGAHLNFMEIKGKWSPLESQMHINNLELKVVHLALKHWKSKVSGKTVLIATDNTTVVAYINKQGGTQSRSLCLEIKELLQWCHQINTQIRARHIPGRLNVLADALSRDNQILSTEWSLSPQVFKQLCKRLFHPMIDLFATRFNNKLTTFISPIPDPLAFAVDALTVSWKGMWAYAYPPPAIIPLVLNKIQSEDCQVMLIAPAFQTALWYQSILDLLIESPVCLPPDNKLLRQPRSDLFHWDPQSLNLHAWILSNEPQKRRDFRQTLPDAYPLQLKQHQATSMIPNGKYMLLGVANNKLIHSERLHPSSPNFW